MKVKPVCLLLCVCMLLPLAGCASRLPDVPLPVEGSEAEPSDTLTETETVTAEATDTQPAGPRRTARILTPCLYLFEGQSYELRYEAKDPDGHVDWEINTDCVSVKDGTVTAEKEGYAIVSAGEDTECRVKVLGKTMPEIYVFTDGSPIDSKETYVDCTVSVLSENEDYKFLAADAGIRLRGNSTAKRPKKPYRIKFDEKVNLLGMNEGARCKSWVLLAESYDDSMIRNTAALSLAASVLDEYSSDWRFVRLYIDKKDQGVYVLAEQSQINESRVDIEEAGADTDALRSGYFFEIEGSKENVDEKIFVSYEDLGIKTFWGDLYTEKSTDVQPSVGDRLPGYFLELKNDDTSPAQQAYAEKYAQNIFTLLYAATCQNKAYRMDENLDLYEVPGLSPEEAIREAVDVDSMARMYILAELVCNFDAHKKSTYFYVDFSEGGTGKLTFACPWDHDRAFVKSWDAVEHQPYNAYYAAERTVFFVLLMNHEWFRAEVAELWVQIKAESDSFANARNMILDVGIVYADDFAEEAELWDRQNSQREWARTTYDWLRQRIAWLDGQFTAMRRQNP